MSMNIVLLEPEMPANTGNIGRTCVATGTKLHLIKPLGFEITDKMVKRAGLDYWPHLNYEVYENFEDFLLTIEEKYGFRIRIVSASFIWQQQRPDIFTRKWPMSRTVI